MTYKFKLNDFVHFDYHPITGVGKIKGVAVTEMPVVGVTYIVDIGETFDETYPYTSVAIPEIHLTKL